MTEKDLEIQRLRAENQRLRRDLMLVMEYKMPCAVCAYLDTDDCMPGTHKCNPKWIGDDIYEKQAATLYRSSY